MCPGMGQEIFIKFLLPSFTHLKYVPGRRGKGRGANLKVIKKGGASKIKVMSPGLTGGMGSGQFDRRIIQSKNEVEVGLSKFVIIFCSHLNLLINFFVILA